MIHVVERPAPTLPELDFTAAVQRPGEAWLAAHPNAKPSEWPSHWRRALPALRSRYKGICAYFCCYVAPVTGSSSVDHFVAKSGAPADAYKWANYRFACSVMNARKNDASDVLDPFQLTDGRFELVFPSLVVRPAQGQSPASAAEVQATIDRLGLNTSSAIDERLEHWDNYKVYNLNIQRFYQRAPFIAMEAARQGLLKPADQAVTVATIRAWLDS